MATASTTQLCDSKFHYWIKTGMAIVYTKEGLQDIVTNEMSQFQQKVYIDVFRNKGISHNTSCNSCNTESIMKCTPKNKICVWQRRKCNVTHRPCPLGICEGVRDEIIKAHRFSSPSWRNTDARQWADSPWEIAKCFMPLEGYSSVPTVAETDFNGIISVFLNYEHFQTKVNENLINPANIFSKARDVAKNYRHCPGFEISKKEFEDSITILTDVLSDSKHIAGDKNAQIALQRLTQLGSGTWTITDKDIFNHLQDAINEAKFVIDKTKFLLLEEAQTFISTSKENVAAILSNIKKIVSKGSEKIKKTVQHGIKRIRRESDTACKKLKAEMSVDYDFQTKGKEKDQTFRCLKMKDIEQLWSAGKESRYLLLKECERICTFIKNKSDRILYVWPAYDTSEEEEVVFVVVATGDVNVDVGYRTYIRTVDHHSEEGKYVMQSRKSAENRLSASQSEKIRNVIDLYADTLMQDHRYISVITGSGVRSVGFATGNEEIIPEACVVVYILIKGKIPLDEEKIPKTLDGIPVDIREGGFQTRVLTASDFHTNVRMGCQITSSVKPDTYGTIGGFIEHPEYGLCGITCAHVLMNEQYMHNLRGENKSVENEIVYQPDHKHENHRLGPIREVAYKAGGNGVPGIDLAVFQIDSRPPECGNFPGTSNAETNLLYESGNVAGDKQFNIQDHHVVKFGRTSGLTEGFVEFCNTGVRKIDYDREYTIGTKRYTYTLFSQLEIRPSNNGRPFNERGDSGALVFKKDVTGSLICIGMVVGAYSNGNGIVTPISAIKRELGVSKLKNFTENKIDKIERRMQTMEQSIQEIKSTLANLVSNNK